MAKITYNIQVCDSANVFYVLFPSDTLFWLFMFHSCEVYFIITMADWRHGLSQAVASQRCSSSMRENSTLMACFVNYRIGTTSMINNGTASRIQFHKATNSII